MGLLEAVRYAQDQLDMNDYQVAAALGLPFWLFRYPLSELLPMALNLKSRQVCQMRDLVRVLDDTFADGGKQWLLNRHPQLKNEPPYRAMVTQGVEPVFDAAFQVYEDTLNYPDTWIHTLPPLDWPTASLS